MASTTGVTTGESQTITLTGVPTTGTITVGGVAIQMTSAENSSVLAASKIAQALRNSTSFGASSGRVINYAPGGSTISIDFPVADRNVPKTEVLPGTTGLAAIVDTTQEYTTMRPGTGVFAKVNENVFTGQSMTADSSMEGVVFINGYASADITTVLNNTRATRQQVVNAINTISSKTGVKAIDTGFDSKGITLVAADGRNIEVRFETNENADAFGRRIGLREGVHSATYSLESKIPTPVVISSATTGDITRTGLIEGNFTKNESVFNTFPRATVDAPVAQVSALSFSASATAGDAYKLTINGTTFSYTVPAGATAAQRTPQALRDAMISTITTDTAYSTLGVTVAAGRTVGELLVTASTPGTPFTMSTTTSNSATSTMSVATVEENQPSKAKPMNVDDLMINGIKIRATTTADDEKSSSVAASSDPSASAIALATAINSHSHETGVRALANPVVTKGLITTTSLPTTSTGVTSYNLFINGTTVPVLFLRDETGTDRREKVVAAINARTGQHGVSARDNGFGVSLETDGRNLSVWFDSSIQGLTPSEFGLEKGGSIAQVSRIRFSDPLYPTVVKRNEYIEYSGGGRTTEVLSITATSPPSVLAGAMSFNNGILYRGNGTQAVIVGRVDSVNNGLLGRPLRINFATEFVNGGFSGPIAASASGYSFEGWTVQNEQFRLDGLSSVGGWPTPNDSSDPFGAPISDTSILASQFSGAASILTANPSPGGGSFLELSSSLSSVDGYAVIHGPYLMSNEPVEIPSGSEVSFDWRASGGGDAYDVFAYLLNVDTGETIELLNDTGASAGVSTAWATEVVTVPTSGRYKFVFVSGSWDASGGRALGAGLQVDSVKVNASSPPTFSDVEVAQITARVNYTDSAAPGQRASMMVNGVRVESDSAGSASALAESLAAKLQEKISAGEIQNVSVMLNGDQVEVFSTLKGTSFELNGAALSGDGEVTMGIGTVTENHRGNNDITAIRDATASSNNARTLYSTVRLVSDPALLPKLPAPEGAPPSDQLEKLRATGKPFTISVGDKGYSADGNFAALGFQEGTFGGRASEDMDPPRVGRLAFQVGASAYDYITIDLADFGKAGTITGEITGDVDLNVEDRRVRINTRDGASSVLALLDDAMDKVNATRATMGAVMNRLDHVINNLSNVSMNLSESRSHIEDADYAKASTELAKTQIMQQATTAVLAQANLSRQNVLELLKNG